VSPHFIWRFHVKFPFGFPHQIPYIFSFVSVPAIRFAHLILPDLIVRIFDGKQNSLSYPSDKAKYSGPIILIIPIYISNKRQLHTVYFIWNLLYMLRVVHPPIIRSANNLSTASGISHTVTLICRYRGRVGNGLSVLWVAYCDSIVILIGV
jgi:hypothetical protein